MEVCRLTLTAVSGEPAPYPMLLFRGLSGDLTPLKSLMDFLRAREDTSIHAVECSLR